MADLSNFTTEQLLELKKQKMSQQAQGAATIGGVGLPQGQSLLQTQPNPMSVGGGLSLQGMTISGNKPTLRFGKPQGNTTKIPPRQIELLQDTFQVINGMKDLKNRMEKNKYKTGVLSPRFYPGVKGDFPMQLRGTKEEAAFKADTDKYFQKYRKITTGVQAGYPELQWLAADYPKTTDRPDIYLEKTQAAIDSNIENVKNMLVVLENAGHNVDKFNEQLKQYVSPEVDKNTSLNDEQAYQEYLKIKRGK